MAEILKGAPAAKEINEKTARNVRFLKDMGITPKLAILRVGDREDDIYYENAAVKRCDALGIDVLRCHMPENVLEKAVSDVILRLNRDKTVHGVLMMRPMPEPIDNRKMAELLDPAKDADGVTPYSLYSLFAGYEGGNVPCTARACIELLKYYGIGLSGKKAVVIGRSLVIGRPVSMLLLKENATVTVCHTKTQNIAEITRNADIIVTCAGKAKSLTRDMVSPGQVVIDVGMNPDENGKMTGDADFDQVSQVVSAITPVPGGVGSMTTAVLLNAVTEAAINIEIKSKRAD